jgi:hypothetical protein
MDDDTASPEELGQGENRDRRARGLELIAADQSCMKISPAGEKFATTRGISLSFSVISPIAAALLRNGR